MVREGVDDFRLWILDVGSEQREAWVREWRFKWEV